MTDKDNGGPEKTHVDVIKDLVEYTFGLLVTDSMNLIFYIFLFKIN